MYVSCVYSNRYRFVYVATPKVACTSIKRALLPLLRESDMSRDEAGAEREDGNVHRYLRGTAVHLPKTTLEAGLKKGRLRDYFRFSFVRNPWDRLVSCYESKVARKKDTPCPLKVNGELGRFTRGMPFADFVRIVCDIPDEDANVHFALQTRILGESNGRADEFLVDFIGRYERLGEDFAHVVSRIAPGREINLEQWNTSEKRGRRDYRRYYDDGLAAMVGRKFADDIARFGYEF